MLAGFGIMPTLFRDPIYVHKRRRLSSEIRVLVESPLGSVQCAQCGAIDHFFKTFRRVYQAVLAVMPAGRLAKDAKATEEPG